MLKPFFSSARSYFFFLSGVPYEPDALKHPFKPKAILVGNPQYESHSYHVGQLCHQRLKLYHTMKHYKLHVMLALKARLKKECNKVYQQSIPPTRTQAYELMEHVMQKDHPVVTELFNMSDKNAHAQRRRRGIRLSNDRQLRADFSRLLYPFFLFLFPCFVPFCCSWETLTSWAAGYSIRDTRKTFVDLDTLSLMQSFDKEECLLELFDWRDVDHGECSLAAVQT